MNKNLLNRSLLVMIASALTGCGTDEGFGYKLDSSTAVSMESVVNITLSESAADSTERFVTIGLLDGVTSQNVDLGQNTENVLIQDIALEVSVTPLNKELTFTSTTNPVVVNGFNLSVDTATFGDQLTTGETATYSVSYWINNGFLFPCADMQAHPINCTDEERLNNPNRRTLNIAINALPDPLLDIALPDLSVGLNDTINVEIIFTPEYAADPGFVYEVSSGSDIISVSDDGVITGLALGDAVLIVTSIENSLLTQTATASVTNPPKNVASFILTTPAGDTIDDVILIPECTSFDLLTQPTKIDDTQEFDGDFVYSFTAENGAVDIDGFQANTGASQVGYLSVKVLDVTDNLNVSLGGFGTEDDVLNVTVNTADNIACNFADTSPLGPNLLNEEFLVYYNDGSSNIAAFRQSLFIRNGDGNDATLDPLAVFEIDATNGKNGSAAINVTGDGSLPTALYAYHKNPVRALTAAFIDGGLFKISYWVKNNTDASVDVINEIVAGDGNGASTPTAGQFSGTPISQTTTIPASSDWKLLEFDIDVPALTDDQNGPKWEIILMPSQTGGTGNAIDILFDDFAITSNL